MGTAVFAPNVTEPLREHIDRTRVAIAEARAALGRVHVPASQAMLVESLAALKARIDTVR